MSLIKRTIRLKNRISGYKLCLVLLAFCLLSGMKANGANTENKLVELSKEFVNPPDAARPQVYWFWLGGQVTREGITADLEAMKRAGLGGGLIMTMGGSIPGGPLKSIDPDFFDYAEYASKEAARLGLAITLHNTPGWTGSGGPWVKPERSMQRVVSDEVQVKGGEVVKLVLPKPKALHGFYKDIAVLAFPTPGDEADAITPDNQVTVTSSHPEIDVSGLAAGLPDNKFITFPWDSKAPFWIQVDFSKPITIGSIRIKSGRYYASGGVATFSEDGVGFKPLIRFELKPVDTFGYAEIILDRQVTLKSIRFPFGWSLGNQDVPIGHIKFFKRSVNPNIGLKSSLEQPHADTPSISLMMSRDSKREVSPDAIIQLNSIVDLTSKMKENGALEWNAPAGDWTIVRFGHTSNGSTTNGPWGGLECDKLDPEGVKMAWTGIMEPMIKRLGPLAGKTLLYSEIDSWEVGGQNWTSTTELMRNEFKKRRGYDLTPYFPILTGRCVGNPEITERFLWDFRKTVSELIKENYYRVFTKLCHENGLQSMCEPYVGPFESMECGAEVDIPMGEFWQSIQSVSKLGSSIANGYGKKVVAAESFTGWHVIHGGFKDDPYSMKAFGDQMTCWGINRYVFHRMVHQPWANRFPGLGLSTYGINLDRTNTWFEVGRPWFDYTTRCHHLLQQGRTVADIALFCGQASPVFDGQGDGNYRPVDATKNLKIPQGYYWDSINTELLMTHSKMVNGRLTLKSGASYKMLVLSKESPDMTPELVSKLREFVKEGLVVVGARPEKSPSLHQYPACDDEVKKIAEELWGSVDGVNVKQNQVGKGWIYQGETIPNIINELKMLPDVEAPEQTEHIHRDLNNGINIYFVSNQKDNGVSGNYVFRQSGKIPELWNPDTGAIEQIKEYKEEEGRTRIPLQLDGRGAVMVIFRDPSLKSVAVASPRYTVSAAPLKIDGAWKLRFPPNLGAPEEVLLNQLKSWHEHEVDGVKCFSGTATYSKEIDIPAGSLQKGNVARLDLGDVKNLAKVLVNGVDLGILWKPPFQVNITKALKPGKNQLEIQVTNLWVNRLIGDERIENFDGLKYSQWNSNTGSELTFGQMMPEWFREGKPAPSGRITFSTNRPYNKDSKLLPSGLIGPVELSFYKTE